MKRTTALLTAALMLLCCMLAFTGCDTPKEAVIPDGYQVYSNDDISFAYPEGWTKNDGSTVMLVNEAGVGNNITVVYEAKNDFYSTMDVEDFNTSMKPALETVGATITDTVVTQTKNDLSVSITKVSYNATAANGVSMAQTMYITTVGNRTYVITVTVTDSDSAANLVENVFDTLNVVK